MTNESSVTTVLDGRAFLECPRWREGRLWVSDLYAHEVLSIGDGDDVRLEVTMDDQPSGLGWLPDGRLLIVSMVDGRILVRDDVNDPSSVSEHADVSQLATGKLNDMTVDERGHAFISTFGFEFRSRSYVESAVLLHVAPDGSSRVAADDLLFPNGSVILGSPDDDVRTFVVAESMGNRLTAFDLDQAGTLTRRRVWAAFGPEVPRTSVRDAMAASQVAPDGICIGDAGTIWVADALNQRVVRVAEGGEILDEKRFDTGVFACAVGGANGDILYGCAAPSSSEHQRRDTRDASLLATRI
ncbi:SMP-30/gluconolactonase/LRE family protein [Gordonia sp. HY002]|uniref:SMP-30/gluconolactonase/LRE family protein n=2 Tax=Gordonia zhenghanii TaxID=2911516 RepID=UPI001F290575|nr:SMP-30/gluconolactonase/LRE family protein [Gordonia zhenghanii]MCF8570160.1 SMP-30/gluconolactonase/LRE family protein [Gordonia zhenghanii]